MNSNLWRSYSAQFFDNRHPAMRYIGINILVYVVFGLAAVVCFFSGKQGLIDVLVSDYFAFPSNPSAWPTRFYTLLTYQFFHADFFHILFNMLWLYWMGQLFMQFLKPKQFHLVYWGGAIFGGLFFAVFINVVPAFQTASATLIGASAAVMAIFTAVATLVPDYSLRLMFVGEVKIKWLLLVYILLDVMSTANINANFGGSLSHLGGALFGFTYIKLLQNGTDLTTFLSFKPKLKVVKNQVPKKSNNGTKPAFNQQEIDAILDKISKSGYDKLTTKEKQILFDASKH